MMLNIINKTVTAILILLGTTLFVVFSPLIIGWMYYMIWSFLSIF